MVRPARTCGSSATGTSCQPGPNTWSCRLSNESLKSCMPAMSAHVEPHRPKPLPITVDNGPSFSRVPVRGNATSMVSQLRGRTDVRRQMLIATTVTAMPGRTREFQLRRIWLDCGMWRCPARFKPESKRNRWRPVRLFDDLVPPRSRRGWRWRAACSRTSGTALPQLSFRLFPDAP